MDHAQRDIPVPDDDVRRLAAVVTGEIQDVPSDEIADLYELARQHGLVPLLAFQLDIPQLKPELMKAAAQYVLLDHVFQQINTTLSDAGIPVLWFKGVVLARQIYPKPFLRPMGDIDGLIAPHQRQLAHEVLARIGFQSAEPLRLIESQAMQALSHHDLMSSSYHPQIIFELHHRLLGHSAAALLPPEKLQIFWQTAGTVQRDGGKRYLIFQPELHLVYLCAHAVLQHGIYPLYLQRYLDLHLLIINSELNWQSVIHHAVTLRWTFAVQCALTISVQYFNTPLPDDLLEQLAQRQPAAEDTKRVTRLANVGSRFEHVWFLLKALPPRERWQVIRRIAFPPRAYMRERYQIPPDSSLWHTYIYRIINQIYIVSRAVWKRFFDILK